MYRFTGPVALFALAFLLTASLFAQHVPTPTSPAGWYGGLSLGIAHDEDGWNNELGTTLGYDMNRNWALETGVPLYFVVPSSSATSTSTSTTTATSDSYAAFGDAFLRVKYDPHSNVVKYNTSLTGSAPTGSRDHGISSGHATWNWDNKLEKDFGRISPYVQASLANSLANSMSFQRAFTTYGFISQQKLGLSFDLFKGLSFDANYYNTAPLADQTVYSRLVKRGNGNNVVLASSSNGKGHGRPFEAQAVTSGTSSLTKDHGFGAGISANPTKRVEWSLDYSYSAGYQTNTVSTTIGYRFGHGAAGPK